MTSLPKILRSYFYKSDTHGTQWVLKPCFHVYASTRRSWLYPNWRIKVRLHAAINRADFVSWCMFVRKWRCAFVGKPLNHIHQDTKSARLIAVCKRSFTLVQEKPNAQNVLCCKKGCHRCFCVRGKFLRRMISYRFELFQSMTREYSSQYFCSLTGGKNDHTRFVLKPFN